MRVTPWRNGLFSKPRPRPARRRRYGVETLEARTAPGDIAFAVIGMTALPEVLAPATETGDDGDVAGDRREKTRTALSKLFDEGVFDPSRIHVSAAAGSTPVAAPAVTGRPVATSEALVRGGGDEFFADFDAVFAGDLADDLLSLPPASQAQQAVGQIERDPLLETASKGGGGGAGGQDAARGGGGGGGARSQSLRGVADETGMTDATTTATEVTEDGDEASANMNTPPTAVADTRTLTYHATASGPVTANDQWGSGYTRTVTLLSSPSDVPAVVDPSVSDPAGGFEWKGDDFLYIAPDNWDLSDSFTYKISTQFGESTATVTLGWMNLSTPDGKNDDYAALADAPLVVSAAEGVLKNDVDYDELQYPTSERLGLEVEIVTEPTHGTLDPNPTTGAFTYTPSDPNWDGTDFFEYRLWDTKDGQRGRSDYEVAVVTINVAVVPEGKLRVVTYESEHEISSDPDANGNSTTYGSAHWFDENLDGDVDDANDHQYPAAYTRGSTMDVSAEIKLDAAWSGQVLVRANGGPGNVNIPETAVMVNGDSVTITNIAATNPFVNQVEHFSSFALDWEISFNGGTNWDYVGTSINDLYLTFANPTVTPLFHTVVHIGSHNAAGETAEADVVAAVWNEFSDRNVTKVVEGTQLKYWDGGAATATDTAGLLQDANGQCGSWAEFLIDTFAAQGIGGANKILVLNADQPVNQQLFTGMLVKNWNFIGAGISPTTPPYKWVEGQDALDQPGAAGQGNADPPGRFLNHFIVKYDGKYYDPSYGNGPFNTQNEWENGSLDGFVHAGVFQGNQVFFAKPNDLNVVETNFIVI